MITDEQIRMQLDTILVPGAMRSLGGLNLIRTITISDKKASVVVSSAALNVRVQEWIKTEIKTALEKMPEVEKAEIIFSTEAPKDINKINHVIAVMSGKGGVGKSLVASIAAVALKRQGYKVGILDADITGPSIPKMFGITGKPTGSENGIIPVLSRSGIAVMSINLLLPM